MVSGLFQERLGDGHFVLAPSVLNPEGTATVRVPLTLGLASFFVIVLRVLGMEALHGTVLGVVFMTRVCLNLSCPFRCGYFLSCPIC